MATGGVPSLSSAGVSHRENDDIGLDFVDANIGAVLEGRYLLLRTLGSGGMGIVYEAQHQAVRSRHAVKILHKHLMQRSEVVRRFLNEARAAGSLGHPHIVRSTDMGKTPEGIPFVVFEYLEGVTLKEELVDLGTVPVARAVGISIQLASALEAAHEKHIIHRDVKPENIFLVRTEDSSDCVKLLDFGIAKFSAATTTVTSDGKVFGSPQYMAPEQFRDAREVDARTDVYALGVLLYEMLSGRAPFSGAEPVSLVQRVRGEVAPSLADAMPAAPDALVRIVNRALAGAPAQRHQSMAELRDELEAFRADPAAQLPAASVRYGAHARARWVAGVAAALCVLAALAWWRGGADRIEERAPVTAAPADSEPGAVPPSLKAAPVLAGLDAAVPAFDGGDAGKPTPAADGAKVARDSASRAARRVRNRKRRVSPNEAGARDPNAPPMFTAPPR